MEKLDKMDSGLLCIHQTMEAIQQQTDETYPLVVKLVEVIQRLENSLQDLHMKVDLLKISK